MTIEEDVALAGKKRRAVLAKGKCVHNIEMPLCETTLKCVFWLEEGQVCEKVICEICQEEIVISLKK